MREIPIPETHEACEKKKRELKRVCRFLGVMAVSFVVLAIACLLGVFIAVIVAEFHRADAALCYTLAGGMGGGAIAFALLAFLVGTLSGRAEKSALDFFERCDGPHSFFVGDGTIAAFEEGRLLIHGEDAAMQVAVPYSDIRAFSVCSRTLPREAGEWSVVFEIPRKYLMKAGTFSKDDPPALVQTDAKERLFSTLEKFGIEVLGERRPSDMPHSKRFKAQKKFFIPDQKKRNRTLLVGGLGLALIAAGIPIACLYNITAGTVCCVLGLFLLARAAIAFVKARSMLAFYEEGVYWRETERRESVFLKWGEIESVQKSEQKGLPILTVHCAYGDYFFPAVAGSYEYIQENHPEKSGETP